jgi:hypothetical protein
MKFGQLLEANILDEWRKYYVNYRQIKNRIEQLFPTTKEVNINKNITHNSMYENTIKNSISFILFFMFYFSLYFFIYIFFIMFYFPVKKIRQKKIYIIKTTKIIRFTR